MHVGRVGKRGAHALVDVDQWIDQDDGLEPMEAPNGDGGQPGPLVVGTAEECDGQHDEAEHQPEVARFEAGAEQQAQRGHGQTGQWHHGHDDEPVEIDLGLDAGSMDNRCNGEHDDGRDQPLGTSGDDLRNGDQPDWTGSLHPVLDFSGESEFLRQLHGDGLNALEHDGEAHHTGNQDGGEGRLRPGDPAGRTDALTDLREDIEKHEAEKEWLDQSSDGEFDQVFPHHHQVAHDEGAESGPTGRGGGAGRGQRYVMRRHASETLSGSGIRSGGRHQSRRSFPVSPMNTVSRVGSATERSAREKPPDSAASTTLGTKRSEPCRWSSTPPSTVLVRVTPSSRRVKLSARASGSPSALTVTMVSAPTLCLRADGVSRARILPWSMMATRPHSLSASSM